jgi:hypothetical protein
MANDGFRIENLDQLREVIGHPNPVTAMKVADALDEYSSAYIQRSPFLLMATSDAEGNQDVSPKGDAPGSWRSRMSGRC